MIRMVKPDLDEIDFRIAYELKNDCRISYKQLGSKISLSSSSVYERTKKMEEKNVILSYNAKVDWGKFGYSIHAFILLKDDKFIGDMPSLYYEVVVIRAPLQGLCYTVKDAVDWYIPPTTRWF